MPNDAKVTSWDEKGNPVPSPQPNAFTAWDEKGNPISSAPQQAEKPKWPVVPQEGESFEDTLKRAEGQARKLTPEEIKASSHEAMKKIPTVLGASLLAGPALLGGLVAGPAEASAAVGGGVLGGAASGAVGGAATELINKGLHAAAGQNVLTGQSAKDIGASTLVGAAAGAGAGLFEKVASSVLSSKLARGMVNASVGTTARDVTYGNPAVGMLKANVTSPITGDLELYKNALRSGATPEQALVAAGGRVSQVAQKIQQLAPQLDHALASSTTPIKVADAIDKPLMQAMSEITNNRAMTEAEKMGAISQLGELQRSLKEGLGDTITPLEANQIKQAIGNRINWAGNVAVTDEIKPAYRAVYGSLKQAVNKAVPGSAQINEDLTNLLAAQTDLEKLMKAEEAGMGKGALGSAVTGIARRFEAIFGRAIPGMASTAATTGKIATTASGPTGASIFDILKAKGVQLPLQPPNQPGLPFNPNKGQP